MVRVTYERVYFDLERLYHGVEGLQLVARAGSQKVPFPTKCRKQSKKTRSAAKAIHAQSQVQ